MEPYLNCAKRRCFVIISNAPSTSFTNGSAMGAERPPVHRTADRIGQKPHRCGNLQRRNPRQWPETRILMLTHVKELIEQNAQKMLDHWPNAPLGIYSAGMRRRDIGEPITFAGIQSVRNKADQIGHVDLVLIDECHLVSAISRKADTAS
jgi:hypothetical protein